MSDVVRLMSRQLGEAMMDSLGIQVDSVFTVGINLEKALLQPGSTADIVLREGDVVSIPKKAIRLLSMVLSWFPTVFLI